MDIIDTTGTEWVSDDPQDKPCWRHETGKPLALMYSDDPTQPWHEESEGEEPSEPWVVHIEHSVFTFETEQEAREYIQDVITRDGSPSGML